MDENSSSSLSEEESCLFAMKLATACVLPAALKAAIDLDLLELIKKAGPGAFVSAAQLAAQIPTTNPEAHAMVDRILRLLAANDILNCTGGVDRRLYSLGPVCKYLTRNENDDALSLAPQLLMNTDRIFSEPWYHLKDAVVEGGVAFNRAYGMGLFEFTAINPTGNELFNQAMSHQSTLIMKKILETYNGFAGLESIVDVGGGIGASLNMIASKYPSIKAINFDLPHVIQHADRTSHTGVEHISGDMFVKVPRADAIFMKWICHDWSDTECLKILRKCHEALPDNGKVIIAERILPEIPNKEMSSVLDFTVDVIMLAFCPGGKERTEKEFQTLAKASGFKEFRKVCCAFTVWIIELYK